MARHGARSPAQPDLAPVIAVGRTERRVVVSDRVARDRMVTALAAAGIAAPVLPTGAGHDAGVLAARVPAGMLFVRNPTGVSHSPAEHAEPGDCATGVRALAAVLEDLACR